MNKPFGNSAFLYSSRPNIGWANVEVVFQIEHGSSNHRPALRQEEIEERRLALDIVNLEKKKSINT